MGILLSPGVDITVIDESFFVGATQGTTPLILIATRENKVVPGTGGSTSSSIASGTLKTNAKKVVDISSQRELVQMFGDPIFVTSNGTPLHGNELNEYGLQAAFSFLGIANRVFIVRSDVDLEQLTTSSTPPVGLPLNGTYWLDLTTTDWGLFRGNGNVVPGLAFDKKTVTVLDKNSFTGSTTYDAIGDFAGVFSGSIVADVPLPSVGSDGDFAVVTFRTDNKIFERITITAPDLTTVTRWYLVGSADWKAATPTVITGSSNPNTIPSDSFTINGSAVTLTATDATAAAPDINNASITDIIAAVSGTALQITNTAGKDIVLADTTGTPVEDLGFTATTFPGNNLFFAPHTQIPATSAVGDVYIKTTTPNGGASYAISKFDTTVNAFVSKSSLFFADDNTATSVLGTSVAAGTLYIQYDVAGDGTALHTIKRWKGNQSVIVAGTVITPTLTVSDQFSITSGINPAVTITTTAADLTSLVTVINSAGLSNIVASNIGGFLTLTNTAGESIGLADITGTPLADLGLTAGLTSNWDILVYEAKFTQPTTAPADGTLWYNADFKVDIMVNSGSDWQGYNNVFPGADIILSGSEPTTQTDGTPLIANDLWVDTSDLENYPVIKRFNASTLLFELIDNTDQTTPFGIVFADARQDAGPLSVTVGTTIFPAFSTDDTALMNSDFVDPDVSDPLAFPTGMLLFNTRVSTQNVKEYKSTLFTQFVGTTYTVGNTVFGDSTPFPPIAATDVARFVNNSGNRVDGSPFMGRKAQRNVIVRALAESISSNDDVRAETINFNLIAAPGYVELLDEMVTLNKDKKELAFIVADTPPRLVTSQVQNWATNTALAPSNSEEGLTTADTFAGLYYPWGLSTNTDGFEIMVPPSTIALRTIAFSDQVSFPWFAPAGFNRGVVSNAASVGYLTSEEEFQPVLLSQAQRDILQVNKINPIAFIPGRGLVVFGQKSLHPVTSALDRINVDRLVNFLRFNLDILSKPFIFEPNDQNTRDSIKLTFDRFLGDLVARRALIDFASISNETNNTPERVDRSELWVDIAIIPEKAVEFIFIPIRVLNQGATLPA